MKVASIPSKIEAGPHQASAQPQSFQMLQPAFAGPAVDLIDLAVADVFSSQKRPRPLEIFKSSAFTSPRDALFLAGILMISSAAPGAKSGSPKAN